MEGWTWVGGGGSWELEKWIGKWVNKRHFYVEGMSFKLLKHAFKCYNKRYEKKLREITDTGKMQYGFKSGKEATNVVLALRRMI